MKQIQARPQGWNPLSKRRLHIQQPRSNESLSIEKLVTGLNSAYPFWRNECSAHRCNDNAYQRDCWRDQPYNTLENHIQTLNKPILNDVVVSCPGRDDHNRSCDHSASVRYRTLSNLFKTKDYFPFQWDFIESELINDWWLRLVQNNVLKASDLCYWDGLGLCLIGIVSLLLLAICNKHQGPGAVKVELQCLEVQSYGLWDVRNHIRWDSLWGFSLQ